MSTIGGNNKRGSNLGGRGGTSLGGRGGTSLGGRGGTSLGGAKTQNDNQTPNETNVTDLTPPPINETTEVNNNNVGNTTQSETVENEQTNSGSSIGGPKGGSTIGGGAKGGASLGGPKGGSTIGGGAKGGASLGGPKGGSTIGGGAKGGASLGGPVKVDNTPIVNEPPVNNSPITENNNNVNSSNDSIDVKTSNDSVDPNNITNSNDSVIDANPEQTGTSNANKKKKKKKTNAKGGEKTDTEATTTKVDPKKGPKKTNAALAKIRALQEEQERRRLEDIRLKQEEEERERLRIEREKIEEEERLKNLEIKKKRREEDKEKRKEIEAQRARDEAAKKYGMVGIPPPNHTHTGGSTTNNRGGKKSKVARVRKPNQKQPNDATKTTSEVTKTETPKVEEVKENWDDDEDDDKNTKVKGDPITIIKDTTEVKESWDQESDDKVEVKESWDQEPDVDDTQINIVLDNVNNSEHPNIQIMENIPGLEDENPDDMKFDDIGDSDEEIDINDITLDVDESKLTKQELQKLREEKQAQLREENARKKEINLNRVRNKLRAPICCVLGHVDTGKTLLLDKMRNSNVQAGEAGGITQQIGATFFPLENLRKMTNRLNEKVNLNFKIPGLLVIDTPGHASFTNLRSRGSSLCDISILVIDIMHGIEPQTRESIQLLRKRNTPFVVALNKVDRLYNWRTCPNAPIREALKLQQESVIAEFDTRVKRLEGELAAEGLNACLYYKNKDFRKNISLVPTSAISGEGIPDILMLLIQLTQKHMEHRLTSKSDRVECTVLEVKKISGIGTTIDVILANGTLRTGDTIVIAGLGGEAIVTNIKSLLTPPLMKELRVKSQFQKNNEIHAAMGLKISASNLDDAVPGSQLFVLTPDDDLEELKDTVQEAVENLKTKIHRSGLGVYVQASTLGSMEALLEFLHGECKIPVSGIRIGPVHKKDVMTASVMIDRGRPEFACILAFDVQVTPEAEQFSEQQGVRIFAAEIIYHLEKMFKDYLEEIKKQKEEDARRRAVFPCVFSFMPDNIFRDRDPIVAGVRVDDGVIKVGTPVCIFKEGEILEVGRISSIEKDHKTVDEAKRGDEIAVNIAAGHKKYLYGRHFDHNDKVFSHITRDSLDALKEGFPDFCSEKDNFKILKKMKKVFNIM